MQAPGRARPLTTLDRRPLVAVSLLVAAAVALLDQQTKRLAVVLLDPTGRVHDLPGPLDLQLVFNEGGAFGTVLPGGRWTFLVITVLVVVLVARSLPRVPDAPHAVAYGLLLAGALGNAADRIFRPDHRVVDFLKLPHWPVFNLADVAITTGFLLLLLLAVRQPEQAH